MVAGQSKEELPPGWKEFVRLRNGKKIKYYSLEEDGKKFYSKMAVMRHVNGKTDGNDTPQLKIDGDDTQLKTEFNDTRLKFYGSDTPQPQTETGCNNTPQPQSEIDCNNTPQPQSKIDCNNDPQPPSKMDCNNTVHQQNEHKEGGSRIVDPGSAKSNKKPAWLPPEWITEVNSTTNGASYKVFIDPGTGRRFYSKLAVMRHLNITTDEKVTSQPLRGTDGCNTPQLQSKHGKSDSKSEPDTGGAETGKSLSWLPPGWLTEVKSKKQPGQMYRIYIDPATGTKFYSKPQVLKYLGTLSLGDTVTENKNATVGLGKSSSEGEVCEQKELGKSQSCASETETNNSNMYTATIASPVTKAMEVGFVDGLPDGWTKEIRTKDIDGKTKKDVYYKDPGSSFLFSSKKDALRYVETGDYRMCKVRPKKIEEPKLGSTDGNATMSLVKSSSEGEVCEHQGLEKNQICASERETSSSNKCSTPTACPVTNSIEVGSVDGLPDGWTKEIRTKDTDGKIKINVYYKDPGSSFLFSSKKDALRYVETGDYRMCKVRPKKIEETNLGSTESHVPLDKIDPESQNIMEQIDVSEHYTLGKSQNIISREEEINKLFEDTVEAVKSDPVEISGVDGLPPGWIKELKSRKIGKRKDTFYVDPISGYMFWSKLDALRYIETGDISKCACKPKKRGGEDYVSIQHVYNPSPVGQRYLLQSSNGQHLVADDLKDGKNNSDASYLKVEADGSKRMQENNSFLTGLTNNEVEVTPKKSLRKRERKTRRSPQISEPKPEAAEPKDARPPTNTGTVVLYKQEFPTCIMEQKTGTPSTSKSDTKKLSQSVPGRSSKRLAGTQSETPPDLQLSKRSLRSATRKFNEGETNALPTVTVDAVISVPGQPVDSKLGLGSADTLHEEKFAKAMDSQKHGGSSWEMKPAVHGRASKRLAGCQPEMPPNLQLSERSLRAAMKMACEDEASILPMITTNAVPNVQPPPPPPPPPPPQPFHPNLPIVDANASHEPKLANNMVEQKIDNTPPGLKTSNKRKAKTTPSRTSKRPAAQSTPTMMSERPITATSIRSSKRLVGSQLEQSPVTTTSSVPAVLSQPLQSEPLPGTATGKFTQGERHTFPIDRKHVFDVPLEPLNTAPAPGVAEIVSMVVESISKMDEIELNQKPLVNDQAVSDVKRGPTNKEASAEIKTVSEETGIQLNEKPEFENSKPQYPQGSYLSVVDSWSDPCLDFAFKTLTGAIPLDHTMSYQGSPQPQVSTYTVNGNGQVGRSGSHKLVSSQQNMPSQFQGTHAYHGSFQAQNTPSVLGGNGFFGQSGQHNLVSFQQPASTSSTSSWQHVQVERPRNPSIPPGFDGVPPYRGTSNNSDTRNKDYTRYPGTNK